MGSKWEPTISFLVQVRSSTVRLLNPHYDFAMRYSRPPTICSFWIHLFVDFSVELISTLFTESLPIHGIFHREIFTNDCIFIFLRLTTFFVIKLLKYAGISILEGVFGV